MALFASKEEKDAKKLEKIMGKMRAHRLDSLGPEYAEDCRAIFLELMGNGMMEMGMKLSGANAADQVTISYLNAVMQQNWIIIKQLDRICKRIESNEQ